jgi:hypothetical protein
MHTKFGCLLNMYFIRNIIFISSLLFCVCTNLHAQVADTANRQKASVLHDDTIIKQTSVVTDTARADTLVKYSITDTVKAGLARIDSAIKNKDTAHANTAPGGGYVINGRAVDAHTGEGIPFATVFFPKTPVGTAADINGDFVLKTNSLPGDSLVISAMGYNRYSKPVYSKQHDYNFIAEIPLSTNMLNDVVIHAGEDPAVVLLRRIISRKPYNDPNRTENYKYEAYNKLEVDLERLSKTQFEKIPGFNKFSFIYNNQDTTDDGKPYLPLYMTEALSDYYFERHPKKQREFIKASMVKGVQNESIDKFLGSTYQNVNAYNNFIPVFDKQFVSPISNSGLFYYKYTIRDTQVVYGHRAILVQFAPRRGGENCFYGTFWVVDTVFALQRITLAVPKVSNVNYVNSVSLYQEYAPVKDSIWFCIKDKFIADFNAPYGVNLPGFIGRKTTTYTKILINDTTVQNVLDNKDYKQDVIKSDSARARSDAWWVAHRTDSLTKDEKAIYKMVDTLNKIPIIKTYKTLITFAVTGNIQVGDFILGPYFYLYSNNTVEGNRFRFSASTSDKLWKDVRVGGYLAYGTQDEAFKYNLNVLWLLNRKPRSYLYATYTHDIDHGQNYYDHISGDNIFGTLFRKAGVPYKLAFVNLARGEYFKEFFSGFSYQLYVQHREFSPFAPLPQTMFTDARGNPSDEVISSEAGVRLRFAYKEKFLDGKFRRLSLGSRYPIAEFTFGNGFKNVLNSGYDYQKVRFNVSNTLKIPPLGTLHYNVFAGKFFGTLPYPLLEVHPGNEYLVYNPYAFEMMNKYEFISNEYAGISLEHNIGGGIFNYIPVLKKAKLRQFWTAKGLIGSLSQANQNLNITPGGYPFRTLAGNPYLELGTGISNILEIFRIDFVWRVTPKPLSTEDKARYFGIFFGAKLGF